MKKIKVLLGALALIASLGLIGCTPSANPTSAARKWVAASSDAGVTVTDNNDGTCSFVLSAANNGNAILLYINEDKSVIDTGKTVELEIDYEAVEGKWEKADAKPKFYFCLANGATSSWDTPKTSADAYRDGDATKGTITLDIPATAESNQFKVKFNAWQWAGGAADEVKVTVKKVTVK